MISMVSVLRALANLPSREKDWDNIVSTLAQLPSLEPDMTPEHRASSLPMRKALGIFQLHGSGMSQRVSDVPWSDRAILMSP